MKKIKPAFWIVIALVISTPFVGPRLWQDISGDDPSQRMLMGTFSSKTPSPKWISITGQPEDIAVLVLNSTGTTGQGLNFKMPGFYLDPVLIASQPCSRVSMPKLIKLQTEGLPEVPVLSRNIVVPVNSKTTLKIIKHVTREMKIDPVEPSLGHITRDINPVNLIPQFDEFYHQNAVWPKQVIEVGKTFTMREMNGVNIRVYPLQYDAGKGALLITELLVVDIITTNPNGITTTTTASFKPGSQEFRTVYQRMFDGNIPAIDLNKYTALPSRGRMLIIAHESLAASLNEFINWKQQLGIDVTLRTTAEVGATNASIGTAISDMYKEDAGLAWVILVGDKAQVPTNSGGFDGSDSDSRYTMVDGNDLYPDLYISRISASNTTQLQTQLNKFIAYEKNPITSLGTSWYQRAVGIASNEGSPTDYERAEMLRSDLLGYGFHTVDQIYQGQGGASHLITSALNEGASMVNYLGHGSGTSWGSVYFSTTQVHQLNNGPRWPWIVDVSCSNGDFNLTECLSEAWLRAGTPSAPQGAIGVISSTSLAPWVPPTVMQAEVIDLITHENAFTLGALYYSGLMKVLDEYSGISVSEQVIEQNIIFGDCSLMVRTKDPDSFLVSGPADLSSTANSWSGQVSGPAGSVAALTWDGVLYGVGLVAANGSVEITISNSLADVPQVQLTVSGFNMIPHQTILTTDGGIIVPVDPDDGDDDQPDNGLPLEVQLRGNYPNPFNPSTRIVFDLPREMSVRLSVYDIRGHLVQLLLNESLSAGSQSAVWDGSDNRGGHVSSGVYLYRLETSDGVKTGRMTLSK